MVKCLVRFLTGAIEISKHNGTYICVNNGVNGTQKTFKHINTVIMALWF